MNNPTLIIISGGPGSGKSALIGHLADMGFAVMPEAGRAIIKCMSAIKGPALPWQNQAAYAEAMLLWELRSYQQAKALDGLVFFDRGLPDVAGYLKLCNLPVPAYVNEAIQRLRYHAAVFMAPPWQDIYVNDQERKQSWQEAVDTYNMMVATYQACAYQLHSLPLTPVTERAHFILETLKL